MEDKVYADQFILWCYENPIGKAFLKILFSKKPINKLYGKYKSSKLSAKQIKIDIEAYKIDMDLFKKVPLECYSDFFLREFKDDMRPFSTSKSEFGAPGEGRYLGFKSIKEDHRYPVKGQFLTSSELLGGHELSKTFQDGPILICRLCPVDYHHFHYPDNGNILTRFKIHGDYHSVNVHALRNRGDIFIKNEREITIIQTENFGKIAYIEVGAMCVGKIKQNRPEATTCLKGEQKGHFEFGGSTIIILGESSKWTPSKDILEHSSENRESFIKLGDCVASNKSI
ncbi:MAG: phosphatidylserine decarboxylase [Bacteriovoracaceae bacterium]|jgi:phosphatidylserine decarboxylase